MNASERTNQSSLSKFSQGKHEQEEAKTEQSGWWGTSLKGRRWNERNTSTLQLCDLRTRTKIENGGAPT